VGEILIHFIYFYLLILEMSIRCVSSRPIISVIQHKMRDDCRGCDRNSDECNVNCNCYKCCRGMDRCNSRCNNRFRNRRKNHFNWCNGCDGCDDCRDGCNDCNNCDKCDEPKCLEIKKKFNVNTLIANIPGRALVVDPNLVNSWGIIVTSDTLWDADNGTVWVADNGTGLLTSYTKIGTPVAVVTVPGPGGVGVGAPDGIVSNCGSNFIISNGPYSGPATILISTEDGLILGYSPKVNASSAIIVVDNSGLNTVYKGLAITATKLYACDFRHNKIDTFGPNFSPLSGFPFSDPDMPAGFAPFNIVFLYGILYVLYAQQDSVAHDDVAAPGNGFINAFTTGGTLIKRLVSRGYLNSPWGLIPALDICNFPKWSILVGNFGDGRISAYDANGKFLGMVEDRNCSDVVIQGLWGLANDPSSDNIYFASGPNNESNGLVGFLSP
jgi:uncharacterized protein (TIGR03118 family)